MSCVSWNPLSGQHSDPVLFKCWALKQLWSIAGLFKYSALQSQYTVAAHLKSKHILLFGFARQYRLIARVCAWTVCLIKTVQRCSLCGVRVVIEKCVTSCPIKTVQRCSLCGVLLLKRVFCLAAEGDLFSQERSPPVERVGVAGPHPYSSRKNKSPY